MILEKQVCSLELAKRLKELGVKQESYFYYGRVVDATFNKDESGILFTQCHWEWNEGCSYYKDYSAFTVAELGEILFAFNIVTFKYKKGKKYIYEIAVQDMEMRIYKKYQPSYKAETEADARAKMLIYLIENGLINKEVNYEKGSQ